MSRLLEPQQGPFIIPMAPDRRAPGLVSEAVFHHFPIFQSTQGSLGRKGKDADGTYVGPVFARYSVNTTPVVPRKSAKLGFIVAQCITSPRPVLAKYSINTSPVIARDTLNSKTPQPVENAGPVIAKYSVNTTPVISRNTISTDSKTPQPVENSGPVIAKYSVNTTPVVPRDTTDSDSNAIQSVENPGPIIAKYSVNTTPVVPRDTTNTDSNATKHVDSPGPSAIQDVDKSSPSITQDVESPSTRIIEEAANPGPSGYCTLEDQRSQRCEVLKRQILKRRANLELAVEFENQFVKRTRAGKITCVPSHHIYLRMGVICLFCLQPYNAKADYVGCDKCPCWYHLQCVNITLEEIQRVDDYICPVCNAISLAVEEMQNHKYGCLFSRELPEGNEFRRLFPKLDCIEDLVEKAEDGYSSLGEFRDQINEMYKNISKSVDEGSILRQAILDITQVASNVILTLIPNHPDL